MKTVKLDPDTWYCGKNGAALRRNDGTMCCLGFYALQVAGLDESDITGEGEPEALGDGLDKAFGPQLVYKKYGGHTPLCTTLIEINDNKEEMSMEERCARLNAECEAAGAKFRFELEGK